ncbi:MAG: hypothetical protein ACREIR_08640 [Geminicoccaceae bacterium]
MPKKVVDLSARSKIIRDEPFGLHFWECTPDEYLSMLRNPRKFLAGIGIDLPDSCRIETTIENHDWLSEHTGGLSASNGTIVCNVGGGNVAATREIYRIISYAHDHASIGKYKKKLLHAPKEQERAIKEQARKAKPAR